MIKKRAMHIAKRGQRQRSFAHWLLVLLFLSATFSGARPAAASVDLKPCPNRVSAEQQIQIGRKAAQQVYKEQPVLPDSSDVTRYVQSIGQKLASFAPGQPWPFNFHVVNSSEINAFALPGGTVFVNLGAIQAADNEAQLAAVMAHEMSHVVLQHSICNMEKEQRVGIISGLGQLAAGAVLGGGVLGKLAQETIGLGTGLGFLKMSRGAEKEADEEGVSILYNAGYDPRAMPQFFEIIEGKYGKGGAQFLSDHPNPGNRTEYINAEIATFPRKPRYVTNTPEFKQIHQKVAGMHAYTAKEIAYGEWKRTSPNQTVSTGINEYDAQTAGGSVDLSSSGQWNTFKGDGFTMQVPGNWRVLGDQNSAMVAPPGGIVANGQQANLVYGILTDVYSPQTGVSRDQLFKAMLDDLSSQNPGLQPSAPVRLQVGGRTVESTESVTRASSNGRGEHDWIVGFPTEGSLRYFVFVSPEQDFNSLRPTFQRVLNSVQMQ